MNTMVETARPTKLPLAPIEQPKDLFTRILFWMSRRMFGKVIMPMKVMYARSPALAWVSRSIQNVRTKKMQLSALESTLILVYTAAYNECAFCHDLAMAEGVRLKIGAEKFQALAAGQGFNLPVFTAREQAMLGFVDEMLKSTKPSEEAWRAIKAHCSEREIVEVIFTHATEVYYNTMNHALQMGSDELYALAATAGGKK